MSQATVTRAKITTEITQHAASASRPSAVSRKSGRPPKGPRVTGEARESVRPPDRPVLELEFGILVYPPAVNMERPGADLIRHYLDPDRLPVEDRWSRKHARTQRRLCERFAAPVIDAVTCQDIRTRHAQQIVNAAPTAGEGDRVHRMLSAMVSAGIDGGYLANPRLAMAH